MASASGELTPRALLFGLALGALLAAANVYAGLKLGFVDVGTTTIVLLAFAVFGAGRRPFAAREANAAQVVGSSAGAMAVTAGVIGPIPALALGGHDASPLAIVLFGCALAVFGTLIAIPFRDSLIAVQRLAFPSARAAGEVIRSLFIDERSELAGGRSASVQILVGAALAAAAVTVARDAFSAIPGGWMLPVAIAGVPAAALAIGAAASPLLAGVGLLVSARTAASMLIGAAIAWIAIAPVLVHRGAAAPNYGSVVSWTLWPGAALMVAGSLTALVLDARALLRAIRAGLAARAARWVKVAALAAALAVIAIGWQALGISPLLGALAVALAALFSVAGMHATGETDHTPAGPLGGLTQVVVGALGPGGIGAPLAAGAIVNGATAHSSTMLNAWKTGDVVGDCAPGRLVVAQLAGIAAGAVASALAYWLVREAYGIGTVAMPAHGAVSWKATADAVAHGTAGMPPGAPLAALLGAAAGVALALVERTRLRRFTLSPIALGVGFIVPASLTVTVALAALASALAAARAPAWHARHGAALAGGLIVGEAFTGVVLAAVAVARAGL